MKIHFIAISDSTVQDIAIGLVAAGHSIGGSALELDEITKAKFMKPGLSPEKLGWIPDKINNSLNGVIVGASVLADNPELLKAHALKIPIYSYPDFIYKLSQDKQRLVVAGSFGKTMITSMIIHVLKFHKRKFDYVITKPISANENLASFSDAPVIIIEGQDIMASTGDLVPAFLKYHHHVGVISGIEWQQSKDFPTKEVYAKQFELFASATPKGGILVYFELDPVVAVLSGVNRQEVVLVPYKTHPSIQENGQEFLTTPEKQKIALKLTGKQNMQNISAAQEALKKIGISSEMFYRAISSFEGIAH